METIILSFKNYLWQAGYSVSTRNTLPVLVAEFLTHQHIIDISYIEQSQVKSFYEYLPTRPLKLRSGALSEMMIAHYVYALKTFFTWAEKTGQLQYNPISGMKFKKPRQNVREPLTKEEIATLFSSCDTLKQTAVLHLFYSCGLRRSEAVALNISDVHFKNQLLYVREGKGAKRRVIPITDKVTEDLRTYYEEDRNTVVVNKRSDAHAFIVNAIGNRMNGQNYIKVLKALLHKAGLSTDITLHHLRHSIATHLLQGGMSMEYVRDFLGHRFLESTQIYAKASTQQLRLL